MNFKLNPDANIGGTSFHDVTINHSFDGLVSKLGEPHCVGDYEDKVRYEWFFTSEDGRNVTLYDWKEYSDKPEVWNVGGLNKADTELFKRWFSNL
jgi:hypothetical protein